MDMIAQARDTNAGGGGRKVSEVAAYKSISEVQPSSRDLVIQVPWLYSYSYAY